jgi:multicomponent Na+:H+ antiporter subunit D
MNYSWINQMQIPASLNVDGVFGALFVIILIGLLALAAIIPPRQKAWWPMVVVASGLVIAAQIIENTQAKSILIDAAALLAVSLVWIETWEKSKSAWLNYLVMIAAAIVMIETGSALIRGESIDAGLGPNKLAYGLLIAGFCLKLAFMPLYFWLPDVAEQANPLTSIFIISIVDIGAFLELFHLRTEAPYLFEGYITIWMVIAILCMLAGAVLALAQNNVKRMLAFSTIDDMGYLLIGLLAGTDIGLAGTLIAAICHAVFKLCLFGAVAVVEKFENKDLTLTGSHGLAARYPISSTVFILSALGMIGVPPLLGFSGRWRLYLSGYELGGFMLAATMALATGLALLYYVRVIHKVWLGQPAANAKNREPITVKIVLMIFVIAMLVFGLMPGWITGLLAG